MATIGELRYSMVFSVNPEGLRWRVAFWALSWIVRLCGVKVAVGIDLSSTIGTIEPRAA